MTVEKSKYFKEVTLNLQYEGFAIGPEEDGLLPVELEGQCLCQVTDSGGVRYWKEDVNGDIRSTALDRVTAIVKTTAEYIGRMEAAPHLAVGSLKGDYRLLAEFNNIVLAGHQTKYGAQFITWERAPDHSSLGYGHFYGPVNSVDCYAAAKQNFAIRSGLVPNGAFFTPEQLTEIYRSIHETLESDDPITDERMECLESAAEQIEHRIPDLEARVNLSNQKESELNESEAEQSGMKLC